MKENPEKREHWRRHVDGWKSSGLTRKAFCEQNGIKLSTLDYWCKKLGPSGNKNNKSKNGWIPLRLAEEESSSAIDLRVGRMTIAVKPGFDPALLMELLRAINSLC